MSGFSQLEVQKKIYERLTADATLMGKISDVYDFVTLTAVYPYVTIGNIQTDDWSTKTASGMRLDVTLHIYSQYSGRQEVIEIQERLHALLHNGSFTLSGHALAAMRYLSSAVELEKDGMTYHGSITFQIFTQATA